MSDPLTSEQRRVFDGALSMHRKSIVAPCVSWIEHNWEGFKTSAFRSSEQRYNELLAISGWDEDSDPIARDAPDLLSPLGRARDEPIHTLILAHLLDPRGRHGLKARFLEELIEVDATDARVIPERSASLLDASSEHQRQHARVDLWIEIKSSNLLVVIENKIDAEESEEQLSVYDKMIDDWCHQTLWSGRRILLTPQGRSPRTSVQWNPMSYFALAIALRRAMRDGPSKYPYAAYPYAALYLATILREIVRVPRGDGAARRAKIADYLDGFMNGVHA